MDNNKDTASLNDPLTDFSDCHVGIIKNFESLRDLATKKITLPVSQSTQDIAGKLYRFFHDVVLTHHQEEEKELFNVVLDCAHRGDETESAKAMIKQLTNEHRMLEMQWKLIEPDIKLLSKGKPTLLDQTMALRLANAYLEHASFEETEFLPLSATILGEKGLSSLGMSIHMRHSNVSISNYI